jgi:hypothetical protein
MQFQRKLSEIVKSKEPQLIAFNAFINEDETEMTSIQVHPNAASMDFHLKVNREIMVDSMSAVADSVEPKNLEYYGSPPESLQVSVAGRAGDFMTKPIHLAGFTRPPAG